MRVASERLNVRVVVEGGQVLSRGLTYPSTASVCHFAPSGLDKWHTGYALFPVADRDRTRGVIEAIQREEFG